MTSQPAQTLPEATETTPPLSDDILRGADEIAAFVFGDAKHRRKIYYLTGDAKITIPHFKLGSVICARKSTLMQWIEDQERRKSGRRSA